MMQWYADFLDALGEGMLDEKHAMPKATVSAG